MKSKKSLLLIFTILSLALVQVSCKKSFDTSSTDNPTKFSDLRVDPAFQFESFVNLNVTIGVPNNGTQLLSIVHIYQGDPKTGGKLISAGATDVNSQYKTSLRVPSRLTELWVGKISPTGGNEYIAVPLAGTNFNYTFGKSGAKSSEEIEQNDCNTGTPITTNGTYIVNSGVVRVVQPGVNLSNLKLTINPGGTVRICGTANITELKLTGTLIVSPTGYITVPLVETYATIENYGTANFAQSGSNKLFTIKPNTTIHNWGTITFGNNLKVDGTLINEYHLTVAEKAETYSTGQIINYCQFFVNSTASDAFKIVTGTVSLPGLVNQANAYLKVNGKTIINDNKTVTLGLQSLIETGTFDIRGNLNGPSSQGAQIHALGSSQSNVETAVFTGYIDFWASSYNHKSGTFGSNITWHTSGIIIPSQDCSAPTPPVITSSLFAAGVVGTPITPYVITATGTDPITFDATNLPGGLTFNASTHTISGTPTTVQVKNTVLTADNLVGIDTKTLEFTIINPGDPPVITSATTAHTPVNQSFTYLIEAIGTGTITFNASNLPSGLVYNPTDHTITGFPESAGIYNIAMTATSIWGSDNKTLVLTVGTPPSISSALTAEGTTTQQFIEYSVTASGSSPITFNATNLPDGLYFSNETNSINGTPSRAGVVDVTLTASNEYGNDTKTLVITTTDPITAPQITSPLIAEGVQNQPFSYMLTATGTQRIVFNASNLPAGLSYDADFGVISGVPTATGATNVTLTATNSAGTDTQTLVITVYPPAIIDADGDGIADALDAYPDDPTRAFNSFYPNEIDYASYAFEDLWPSFGDYDFNDMVINFNYQIVTNAQNKVVDLIAKFRVKSAGAAFNNGFGISLNTLPANVESVTGCIQVGSVVNIDPKGYEAGHTTKTVIIPVDAVNTLFGSGIINTEPDRPVIQPEFFTVTVHLSTPQNSIGTAPFNPFIFINQDRAKEVHLKDHAPTELANPVYFATNQDASDPEAGLYYRSATGLPWCMEIAADFDYPIEKADILQTYQHFAGWAKSSGTEYTDWYMDKPGFRVLENIY